MKIGLTIAVVGTCLVGYALGGPLKDYWVNQSKASAKRAGDDISRRIHAEAGIPFATSDEIDSRLESWLSDLRAGKNTNSHWAAGNTVMTLYAVRSWKVVDNNRYAKYRIVRINSSNVSGVPITTLWEVWFEGNKIMSITRR